MFKHLFYNKLKNIEIYLGKENKICDEECKGGCWGPGNGLCRFCKNFQFVGKENASAPLINS